MVNSSLHMKGRLIWELRKVQKRYSLEPQSQCRVAPYFPPTITSIINIRLDEGNSLLSQEGKISELNVHLFKNISSITFLNKEISSLLKRAYEAKISALQTRIPALYLVLWIKKKHRQFLNPKVLIWYWN